MTDAGRQTWLSTAPACILVVDESGALVDCNDRFAEIAGLNGITAAASATLKGLFTEDSVQVVSRLDRDSLADTPAECRLTLADAGNGAIPAQAIADTVSDPVSGKSCLRLTLLPCRQTESQLRRDHDMMDSIISASSEALWCIEYVEPVDLTAPEDEVLRQFFDSMCFWRILNPAMQELYKMPLDRDVRNEDVRFIFPKNAENEEFVRNLLANRFHLDKAVSLDKLYDGTWITAENDVRAHIHENRLIRLWGTVRPIGGRGWKGKNLESELDKLSSILSALPEPVLVLDKSGRLAAANPAVEWQFGWSVDDILGQSSEQWLPGLTLVDIAEASDVLGTEYPVSVVCGDGTERSCICRVGRHGLTTDDLFAVLALRPVDKRQIKRSPSAAADEKEASDALL
ncbi:MAG: PAS domain-containing protein [Alphaproteobacteria bacterium]